MPSIDYRDVFREYLEKKSIRLFIKEPDHEFYDHCNWLLNSILSTRDLSYLLESIESILHELINNAYKASAKRAFFHNMSFENAPDEKEYKNTIKKFTNQFLNSREEFTEKIKDQTNPVQLIIQEKDDNLEFVVSNEGTLYDPEKKRIQWRQENTAKYDNFIAAYDSFHDQEEGAGLGLLLIHFIMKNIGLPDSDFTIESKENKTTAKLILPYQIRSKEIDTRVKNKILEGIDLLPSFPPNIFEIVNLCKDPESSMGRISRAIEKDPALSADVLKMANSPGFFIARRIDNINDALVTIGLNQLETVLMAVHIKKILDKNTAKYRKIWKHSFRTATYCTFLREHFKLKVSREISYLAGLLHDLGKLAILSIDDMLDDIIKTIINRNTASKVTFIEETTMGISHVTIGALLAKKWQFPDRLVEAIKFHHDPRAASENTTLIYLTYLGNFLTGFIEQNHNDTLIDSKVSDFFNLDKKTIKELSVQCEEYYQSAIE